MHLWPIDNMLLFSLCVKHFGRPGWKTIWPGGTFWWKSSLSPQFKWPLHLCSTNEAEQNWKSLGIQLILQERFSSYTSAPINFIDSMNLCLRTSFLPPNHHIIETFQASCSSDIKMFTFHSGIHCQHRSDKKTKRRSNWILIYLESIIDKSWYWHKSWVLTIK